MDTSFETLKQRYLTLPESVQAVLSSPEMAETLVEIGHNNGLRVDELDALSKQTGFVLLGITHPNDYVAKLRDALPMSRDKVNAIAEAVNQQIFGLVRDSILALSKQAPSNLPHATTNESPKQEPSAQENPAISTGATPNPAAMRTLGNDALQARMTNAFRMAPDTVTVKQSAPTPAAPVQDGKYAGADPYREPVN